MIIDGLDKVPGLKRQRPCLYVGANYTRAHGLEALISWGWEVHLLEVCKEHADFWATTPIRGLTKVTMGDVRDPIDGNYEAAIWWHGVEHVPRADVAGALFNLEAVADLVVLACPNNTPTYTSHPISESHLWSVQEKDLQGYGYQTFISPTDDPSQAPHIIGYKYGN